MSERERIGIYGVGHFGHAMLRSLDRRAGVDLDICAFDRNESVRAMLRNERRHPYYDVAALLPEAVRIVDSPAELLASIDVLILAVASDSTREVAGVIADQPWNGPLIIVNTAKALDFASGRRLSEIVCEVLAAPPAPFVYAALAGGTIAGDVLHEQPLGLTIACEDTAALSRLKRIFGSPQMWVQTTTDLLGVEYAGALKNVIAICAGMAHGLGLSYGSQTHLISRMAWEVEDFCVRRLGAHRHTFSIGSQSWGSDLWMSCTGKTRNRAVGELLGAGRTLDEASREMAAQRKTVEGVHTLRAMESLFARYQGELPLLRVAERVILHAAPPRDLIDALMCDDVIT